MVKTILELEQIIANDMIHPLHDSLPFGKGSIREHVQGLEVHQMGDLFCPDQDARSALGQKTHR